MSALPRGLCVPLPIALDSSGKFDAPSQERLVRFVVQGGASALLSSTAVEGLSPEMARAMDEACHFSAGKTIHLAGVTARHTEALLANLEYVLKIGAHAAVLNPCAVTDAPDPAALFLRHILPLFEKLNKSLPMMLEDSCGLARLRTRDLKHVSRLDIIAGTVVSGSPKIAGNFLKAARHYKARHEFGVYLGNAEHIFSLFKPIRGAVDVLRDHWMRLSMEELPQGIAPMSACLFPGAWSAAWDAAVQGNQEKMSFYEKIFKELGSVDFSHVRAALVEEGFFKSETPPSGGKKLELVPRRAWLEKYFRAKKALGKIAKVEMTTLKPEAASGATLRPERSVEVDVVGIGGVVLDEFRRVSRIAGAESKVKVEGTVERLPGGVMLNQLSWLAALGMPSALFGYVGGDQEGEWLRGQARMRGLDVSQLLSSRQSSEVSRIFVDADGEREIYLESGAVCATSVKDILPFVPLIQKARIVSVEVSLLPLSAVEEVIRLAHANGKPVALDLDIPASQATGKAGLGSRAQLERILKGADYVKSSRTHLRELASTLQTFHKKYGKKKGCWVAATDGVRGSQLYDGTKLIKVATAKGVSAVDSTGCGDAYMAGLISATLLGLPLKRMGELASACGAACATHFGGATPLQGARSLIFKYDRGPRLRLGPEPQVARQGSGGDGAGFLRLATAELQKFSSSFREDAFEAAKALIRASEAQGKRLHVTGVGKPEYVAGYIASSFSSTGTPAFFLHATEAGHGASGQVSPGDVVVAISNSGETEELKSAVATVKKNGAKVIGVTGKMESWLARQSDVVLFAGVAREGDALNLAPRASVLAEMMVLSALGVELQHEKKFSAEDFRTFHPGGSLGKRG